MYKSFLLILLTLLIQSHTRAQAPASSGFSDSADGFQQQLEELIAIKKSGDQTAFQSRLDVLAIPNVKDWITAHFSPFDAPKLQSDYPLSLAGFQKHLSWVVDNAAHMPGWELTVKPSELPSPAAATGPESDVPLPTDPVSVENFRYGPAHSEDNQARSWVNSFIYMEGRFRYVGGTYPFWSEELHQVRSPQARALTVHAARLVHKVSPEYPKKARKEHVEGTVRLHAIIGKDGAPRELIVISGDPLLTDAALKAVRKWRYEPTILNGQPIEVDTKIDVTFAINH
jgi:TonB family protein